jgi:hypothetical protein
MGTVIYSASPFQAFLGTFEAILFIFVIGLIGLGIALFRRKQGRSARILVGILGIFLVIVSFITAAITMVSITTGVQTVSAQLNTKSIAEDNCGDNGETCTRYVLETMSSATAYDFNVPQDAYDKAQVNTCYKFFYYPGKGLFSNDASSYQQINNVSRIEVADPSGCQ